MIICKETHGKFGAIILAIKEKLILNFKELKRFVASPARQFCSPIKNIYIYIRAYLFLTAESSKLNFWVWLQVFNETLLKLDLLVYCRKSFSCKQCYNHALFKVSNLQLVSIVLLV